jgi:tRNA-binding EMAP/Myf-like protein
LDELIGKQMPLLLNIEPRIFRGYESQGMIIAADHENRPVFLLPEVSVPSGTKVK